jgi:hypothetical protein
VITELYRRHRAAEFRKFLITIDNSVPEGLDVHIVVDSYGTDKTPAAKAWLAKDPRFHMHFPRPVRPGSTMSSGGSGSSPTDDPPGGVHKSVQALEHDIRDWVKAWNEDSKPFVWRKTAEEILDSLTPNCSVSPGRTYESNLCNGRQKQDTRESGRCPGLRGGLRW